MDDLRILDNVYIDTRYPGGIDITHYSVPSYLLCEEILTQTKKIFEVIIQYMEK